MGHCGTQQNASLSATRLVPALLLMFIDALQHTVGSETPGSQPIFKNIFKVSESSRKAKLETTSTPAIGYFEDFITTDRVSFWFGTGGAGFCISRALALKMSPFASGGRFMRVGDKIRLPDDVTMGYIIEHLLKTRLTVIDEFHSHLEQMKFIRAAELDKQISFSYSQYADEMNVVDLNIISEEKDPTRFYSLHCLLHPKTPFCPR